MSRRGRRHGSRILFRVGLAGSALAIVALIWLGGLFWFVGTVPRQGPVLDADTVHTDAIVVLTGGSQRLTTGFSLLQRGYADKLFISGVYGGVEVQELLKAWHSVPQDLAPNIVLGYEADNTVGNAGETAAWMHEQGYRSLRLVTANYHMKRSLLEFHLAMPEAIVIPHPVIPPKVRLDGWWRWPGSAALLAGEYTKYLTVRLRGWIETALAPADAASPTSPATGPAP